MVMLNFFFSGILAATSFLEITILMPNIVSSQGQVLWAAVHCTNQVFTLRGGLATNFLLHSEFKYANNKSMVLRITFSHVRIQM